MVPDRDVRVLQSGRQEDTEEMEQVHGARGEYVESIKFAPVSRYVL